MPDPQTTADIGHPLTQFERGIIDRALGHACDPSLLDEREELEYRKGYNHDIITR